VAGTNTELKPAEVAERLRVSVQTLAHWRSRGVGPRSYRLGERGGPVRYRSRDVDRWIDERAAQSRSAA